MGVETKTLHVTDDHPLYDFCNIETLQVYRCDIEKTTYHDHLQESSTSDESPVPCKHSICYKKERVSISRGENSFRTIRMAQNGSESMGVARDGWEWIGMDRND